MQDLFVFSLKNDIDNNLEESNTWTISNLYPLAIFSEIETEFCQTKY